MRELENSSAVYSAFLDEWAEPVRVRGPESDISDSVSVSSLGLLCTWELEATSVLLDCTCGEPGAGAVLVVEQVQDDENDQEQVQVQVQVVLT